MSAWQISAMTNINEGVYLYVFGDNDYGWQFEASLTAQGKLNPCATYYGSSSPYKTLADAMAEAEAWLSMYLTLKETKSPMPGTCPHCCYSGTVNVPSPGLQFDPVTGTQRKICMYCWQHFD